MAVLPASAAPPFITLPEAPRPQPRVIDRKFLAVMGFEAAGITGDFYSTALCLRQPGLRETNSWFGSHPSNTRLATESMGIFALEAFGTYELKKPHDWLPFDRQIRRFWWVYPVANGVEHFWLMRSNLQLYNKTKAYR